jgi:hypothetical protein
MSDTDGADFSLAGLRTAITQKYKPAIIDIGEGRTVMLRQIPRLTDGEQDQLISMQSEFSTLQEDGRKLNGGARDVTPEQVAEWTAGLDHAPTPEEVDDFKREAGRAEVKHEDVRAFKRRTVDVLERMLTLVAASESDGTALLEACNHDELLLMEVFTSYSKRTKLGEASASSSSSEPTAGPSSTTSASSSV